MAATYDIFKLNMWKTEWCQQETRGAHLFTLQTRGAYLFTLQTRGAYLFTLQTRNAYIFTLQTRGTYLFTLQTRGAYIFTLQTRNAYLFTLQTRGAYLFTLQTRGAYLLALQTKGAYLFTLQTRGAYHFTLQTRGAYLFTLQTRGAYLFTLLTRGAYLLALQNFILLGALVCFRHHVVQPLQFLLVENLVQTLAHKAHGQHLKTIQWLIPDNQHVTINLTMLRGVPLMSLTFFMPPGICLTVSAPTNNCTAFFDSYSHIVRFHLI